MGFHTVQPDLKGIEMDEYLHIRPPENRKIDELAQDTWDFLTNHCSTELEKNITRAFYEVLLNKGARPF